MKLEELAVEHDYYSSDTNYYSDDAGGTWETMTLFLDEFEDADVDMNLCFRWDVKKKDDGTFNAEVFLMHQRKGIYAPHFIKSIEENEVDRFEKYLRLHSETILNLWNPIIKL
jgi:hypothetical protein